MVVGDGLLIDGVEAEEAFFVEGGPDEFFVEDGGGDGFFEVVGEVDLADVWVVGGDAMGDDVVQSLKTEVDVPSFEEGVHARADEIVGDPFLACPVLTVVKLICNGGVF